MNVDIFYDDFEDVVPTPIKKHTKYQGIVGLGLLCPETAPTQQIFITISFSPKESLQLNKGIKRKWGDYKVKEQLVIIGRYAHYLDTISAEWEMHFEYTKDMNVHAHCIVKTSENIKDVRIDSKRFYSIRPDNRGFIDIRPVSDYAGLVLYLTNKTEKKYQTTGVKPLIRTPEIKTI